MRDEPCTTMFNFINQDVNSSTSDCWWIQWTVRFINLPIMQEHSHPESYNRLSKVFWSLLSSLTASSDAVHGWYVPLPQPRTPPELLLPQASALSGAA